MKTDLIDSENTMSGPCISLGKEAGGERRWPSSLVAMESLSCNPGAAARVSDSSLHKNSFLGEKENGKGHTQAVMVANCTCSTGGPKWLLWKLPGTHEYY